MTRMTNEQEQRRAEIENALMALSTVAVLLDIQIRTRIRQAVQRESKLNGLLEPTLPLLDRADRAIGMAIQTLSDLWRRGERTDWEPFFIAADYDLMQQQNKSESSLFHHVNGAWSRDEK